MVERFYYYRGFQIGVQPQPVAEPASSFGSSGPVRYRSIVRIRKVDSVLRLDSFTIEYRGHLPFEDEFEAVLQGCYAADRHINRHRAMSAREPHLVDTVC